MRWSVVPTTATDYNIGSGFTHAVNAGFSVTPVAASFASTLAGAEAANDYYTFTIAPTSGYALDLTNMISRESGSFPRCPAR